MAGLMRAVSSEWRKTTATKTWWILAIVILVYSAMMAAPFGFMFGEIATFGGESDDLNQYAPMVYSSASTFGYAIPLVLGALAATSELRHGTLGLTFTIEPRRTIVLLAKVIALLLVGAVTGIAGYLGAIGAGAPLLAFNDVPAALGVLGTWSVIGRGVVALAVWAVIGFGVGLIVKNQAFAIVLAIAFTQFIEPVARIAAQFWDWSAALAKFLPGSAMDSFVGASILNDLSTMDPSAPSTSQALGTAAGFGVLAAYAVIACLIGWLLRLRADVE